MRVEAASCRVWMHRCRTDEDTQLGAPKFSVEIVTFGGGHVSVPALLLNAQP